ncbi:PhnD/SsuA/transferrin family substrate-binding protein [Microbacterium sp. NPDC057650]|uniref:PhnD/SsuA/transferrin family substrate-binding protein n=1 Tax=unclassified Microbacterium TaxID=2609290 RepID=UPI00366A6232
MTIPRTTRLLPAAALALLGVTLAGCAAASADSGSDTDAVTLNVGQLGQAKVDEALLHAAGEDDDLDYTISTALFDSGPAALEAVPSKQIDIVSMADTPMIFGQLGGVEAHIVASADSSPTKGSLVEIVVPADSAIDDVDDLKGKKVATLQGTTLQYSLINILDDSGLAYDEISPVNLSPVDALTALQNGDVDAAALLGPQRAIAVAGGAKTVGTAEGLLEDWTITVATDAALADKDKAAAIEDYLLRLNRAHAWAKAHKEEWAKVYAQTTGLPAPVATAIVKREDFRPVPLGDDFAKSQQKQADAYAALGLFPKAPDVTETFDTRYNDAIAEAQE